MLTIQINTVAGKYNLFVLEDAAQGFGGEMDGKKACSFTDAGTTSFFPAKPLGCYGDGGAIFVDDSATAQYLESLKVHGKGSNRYDNIRIGWNSRLDTLQAAILLPKLKALSDYELEFVNAAAELYTDLLADIPEIKTPYVPAKMKSSWAQYTIKVETEALRDGLQKYLKENDIPTMVYYPKPMHMQQAFENIRDFQVQECKNSARLCKSVLSLPMHPYLNREEVRRVAAQIKKYLETAV